MTGDCGNRITATTGREAGQTDDSSNETSNGRLEIG